MNWIDAIITIVLLYHVVAGWRRGFAHLVANLLSFLGAFWLALRFHSAVGGMFAQKFGLPKTWTEVLGYVVVALVAQVVLEQASFFLIGRIPKKYLESRINKWLGTVLSAVNGLILLAFLLILILALPLRGTIRNDVRTSPLAGQIVRLARAYGGQFVSSLDGLAKQAVKFVTIKPGSNERISLDLPSEDLSLSPDPQSESSMLMLVNNERTGAGLPPFVVDGRMRTVAREKATDMFMKNYFSHYDLEGKTAGTRFDEARIPYSVVGENLAYAPDADVAHGGLMDSEGHRANILEPQFRRIGIGCIDAGVYGKMFVQVFAD